MIQRIFLATLLVTLPLATLAEPVANAPAEPTRFGVFRM